LRVVGVVLFAPSPAQLVGVDPYLVEAAVRSAGRPIEHVRVIAGAGRLTIWLFLLEPNAEAAAEAAFALCRESLRDQVEFADWVGEMQVFDPADS
jgi:hypothetical protein